jgi:ubiquinone/menaquinone biosynthesis C-methylase UbiE
MARRDREAAFHDAAFQDGRRQKVSRFYAVAGNAKDAYNRLIDEAARGRTVLEVGSGRGAQALRVAPMGAVVHGVDVSEVGVQIARSRAYAEGLSERASFHVMDVEELKWSANTFDVVCGSGILHHLDLDRAIAEITRVMKPGGKAVFLEPLGHNPAIWLFRKLTPALRSGDEHPLLMRDVRRIRSHFGNSAARYYGLTSLLAVPVQGLPGAAWLTWLLHRMYDLLLRVPGVRTLAWIVVLELREPLAK